MRIAFDARPLIGPRTGVGVWLEGLLRGLAAETDWRFVLCLPRRVDGPRGRRPRRTGAASSRRRSPLPGTLWLHTLAGPALAGRADVYVAIARRAPAAPGRSRTCWWCTTSPRARARSRTRSPTVSASTPTSRSRWPRPGPSCASRRPRAKPSAAHPAPGGAPRVRDRRRGGPVLLPGRPGERRGRRTPPLRGRPPVHGAARHARAPQGDRARSLAAHALLLRRRPDAPGPRARRRPRLGRRVARARRWPATRTRPRPPSPAT